MPADHRREDHHDAHRPARRETEAGAARHEAPPPAVANLSMPTGLGERGNAASNVATIQRLQATYGNQATRALVQRLTVSRAPAPPVAAPAQEDAKLAALLDKLTKQNQELEQENAQLRAESAKISALSDHSRQLETEIHATLGEIQAATHPTAATTSDGPPAPVTPAATPAHPSTSHTVRHTAPAATPTVEPDAPAVAAAGAPSPTVARRLEMRRQIGDLNSEIARLQHAGGSQAQIADLRQKKAVLAHALLATAHEYKQFDSRWGGEQYGTNTIKGSGCGPTSLAIVLNYLNQEDPEHPKEIRPDETAGYALAAGARVPNVGTSGPTMIAHLDHKNWRQFHGERFHGEQISLSQAVTELGNGNPVIFSGHNIRGTRHDGKLSKPYGGHFMVLSGVNESGTVFNVLDPGRREATDIETITHAELAAHARGFYIVRRAGGHGTPGAQTADPATQTGGTPAGGHSGHSGHSGHTPAPAGSSQATPATTAGGGGRQISARGVRMIAQYEKFSAKLYNDDAGHCTIGYGTLVHRGPINGSEPDEFKRGISEARAMELLRQETTADAETINSHVRVPLNQDQFDALVVFTYNVGQNGFSTSTLVRVLNQGHYDQVPAQMERWNHAGGRVMRGLTTRRAEEAALFSQGTAALGHTPAAAPAPPGHTGGTPAPAGHTAGTHTAGTAPAPTGTPDTGGRQLSHNGVQLISSFEGFDAHLYNDSAGHCTIGYGTLVHRGPINGSEPAEFKRGITRERALELLLHETAGDTRTINSHVRVPLSQDQFDALVSFTYNVGTGGFTGSSLLRVLNAGHYDQVPAQMERWNHAGGRVSRGLTNRRAQEAALFRQGTAALGHTPAAAPAPAPAGHTGGTPAPAGHTGGTHTGGTHTGGTHPAPTGTTPSGASWVAHYPTSSSTDTLHEPFKGHVESFIQILRAAGATVSISATYRPPERAYLMHYAWQIAHGQIAYGHYPTTDPFGIGINWDHGSAAASQAAAQAMVDGYSMQHIAALQSRHTQGRAIDMTITNLPQTLTLPDGTTAHLGGGNGQTNSALWQVGAAHFSIHKLASDPPHWSDDGH